MVYSKVGFAIDARDYDEVVGMIEKIKDIAGHPPAERVEQTPDETYVIFYWKDVVWRGEDATFELLRWAESNRHALIEITEDGETFVDVETDDQFGCDSAFEEILGFTTGDITVWNDRFVEPKFGQIGAQQLADIAGDGVVIKWFDAETMEPLSGGVPSGEVYHFDIETGFENFNPVARIRAFVKLYDY